MESHYFSDIQHPINRKPYACFQAITITEHHQKLNVNLSRETIISANGSNASIANLNVFPRKPREKKTIHSEWNMIPWPLLLSHPLTPPPKSAEHRQLKCEQQTTRCHYNLRISWCNYPKHPNITWLARYTSYHNNYINNPLWRHAMLARSIETERKGQDYCLLSEIGNNIFARNHHHHPFTTVIYYCFMLVALIVGNVETKTVFVGFALSYGVCLSVKRSAN